LNISVSSSIWPSVIEDNIGGDVSRHVAGLDFNDRQGGKRTTTELCGELGSALQKSGVQVEHVARIGFTSGGTAQDEGNLAVGPGVLGKVVIYYQGVLALLHEFFTYSTACIS